MKKTVVTIDTEMELARSEATPVVYSRPDGSAPPMECEP